MHAAFLRFVGYLCSADRYGPAIQMQAFVVHDENIHDLLSEQGFLPDGLKLIESLENGCIIRGLQTIPLDSVQTALKKYNESMRKYHMLSYMPNGSANSEPMGFYLRLFLSSSHNSTTSVSRRTAMTFFSLTGCEFLSHALNNEDSVDSKCHGVRSLCDLINRLATGPPGRREVPVYG
ncbi:uncharacterized protein DEA37_0007937 [Paragonimus westermani]|uniref:Uncharacterized protein n=1 Tax=Paragonimus westermani TaxID=34504 RepID=A0A5J4NQM0_9TREM|nr:uncharacterized protein DEA37_0007937 [Paragonimus westermani]